MIEPGNGGKVASSASMQMAGERCHSGECSCREVDDFNRGGVSDESGVPEGQKRFEIRTGRGLDVIEITVENKGTFRKSIEHVDPGCAYLDLFPGKHRVHVRARASSEPAGMVPSFWISEWSSRTHDWYDSFRFKCGGNEPCLKDHMSEWNDHGKPPRGIYDVCGSSRVENVRWDVAHSPDVKVLQLDMDFTLEVYKFTPRFPHGAKTCKGTGGVEVEEQPKDLPQ